jgi:hypothetical protein
MGKKISTTRGNTIVSIITAPFPIIPVIFKAPFLLKNERMKPITGGNPVVRKNITIAVTVSLGKKLLIKKYSLIPNAAESINIITEIMPSFFFNLCSFPRKDK